MPQRKKGESQVDYLWAHFGERFVTDTKTNQPGAIPSYELMQDLLSNLSVKGVGSITQKDGSLIITSIEGDIMNTINVREMVGQISKFGKRLINKEDIEAGCPYLLYQPVYYILLENGLEFTAPIDVYKGGNTKVITNTVLDNTIYSDLKFSSTIKGIRFLELEDGLAGEVYLQNSTLGIHFSIVTKYEYENSIHDSTTLYFIKGEPYMYFGDTKIGNNQLEDLEDIVNRLNNIEYSINWEENE